MAYQFGEKIRNVREKKGLTMKTVATEAGVTESMISQIETNKVSPSIETLLGIADVLGLDIDYLFSDYKKERKLNVIHKNGRNRMVMGKTVYEQLSKVDGANDDHAMEAYELELAPGGKKGSREYGHKGKELGIILEGNGEFSYGTKTYELKAGDSFSYDSDVPHELKNTGEKKLRAYWVTTPPKLFFKEMEG
ncbi:MAG: helix-turn-helix transcriptional regulator [Spirochaetales bacterium]|nr:helix-turn-helix transcriptional regulator [Spirochaetales bacterium]